MPAKILPFARHALAPDVSSKASTDNLPLDARINGRCHLAGTPRSRHFSNVLGFTPSDAAMMDTRSQSNVVLMERDYSDKSSECQRQNGGGLNLLKILQFVAIEDRDMIDDAEVENEETAIRMRAKAAMKAYREAPTRAWSMREMAKFLHVSGKNYESYESKPERGVPIAVIARFCNFAGEDINWILYGRRIRKTG